MTFAETYLAISAAVFVCALVLCRRKIKKLVQKQAYTLPQIILILAETSLLFPLLAPAILIFYIMTGDDDVY